MKKYIFFCLVFTSITTAVFAQNRILDTTEIAGDFGMGGGMQFGVTALTGSLADDFTPVSFAFEWSGEFRYKRLVAGGGLKYIGIENVKQVIYNNTLIPEKNVSMGNVWHIFLAYDVLKSTKWRLMPFVGTSNIYAGVEKTYSERYPNIDLSGTSLFPIISGIIIDRLSWRSFKDKTPRRRLICSYGEPGLRGKIEYIHPFIGSQFGQQTLGIVQCTLGVMLYTP